MKLTFVTTIALFFVIVGGINWGLLGLINYNLLAHLLSSSGMLTRVIYIIIGIAAIYLIPGLFRRRR